MARQTSIEAYNAIMENGLVGKRQMQAYDILYREGPLTSNQVWDRLKMEKGVRIASHGAGSRLSELRDVGIIQEIGTVEDPITRMRVILWDVTDQLPVKQPPKQSKDQIISALRYRVATLEAEVKKLSERGQMGLL